MLKREELDEIALKVADTFIYGVLGGKREFGEVFIFTETEFQRLTHTLLCEVQKRLEVVGIRDKEGYVFDLCEDKCDGDTLLTTLPLIEE